MDKTMRRRGWLRIVVVGLVVGAAAARGHGQSCAHVNTTCRTKACCATDTSGVPLFCDAGSQTCKRVGLTTSTVPTTTTTTPRAGCVEAGLLCGQKGRPETFRPCCDPAFECRQAEQSGGATGHAMCLLREGPPATTPTTTPPGAAGPQRFTPADVGLAYYASSDDLNTNPVTGAWASQYEKGVRVQYALFVMLPKVFGVFEELGMPAWAPNTVQDNIGKFVFGYSCRLAGCEPPTPPNAHGVYEWRPNYLVDRWHGLLVRLRSALKGPKGLALLQEHADWLPALMGIGVTRVERTSSDKSRANDGRIDGRKRFAPLSAVQCAALNAALAAHDANDGNAILTTQLAFEATARSVDELALFHHEFPLGVHADKSPARRAALEGRKHAAYREWVASFGCATGKPPAFPRTMHAKWKHVRNHLIRVLPEGYVLRELCEAYIDRCPVTGE